MAKSETVAAPHSRFDLLLRIAMPVISTLAMLVYTQVEARLDKLESDSPVAALAELKTQAKSIDQRLERLEKGQEKVIELMIQLKAHR